MCVNIYIYIYIHTSLDPQVDHQCPDSLQQGWDAQGQQTGSSSLSPNKVVPGVESPVVPPLCPGGITSLGLPRGSPQRIPPGHPVPPRGPLSDCLIAKVDGPG